MKKGIDYVASLSFEEYLQFAIDTYPLIFPNRIWVMDQLFTTTGNGYDWVQTDAGFILYDGEDKLSQMPKDYEVVLMDGKAKRTQKSIELYLNTKENEDYYVAEIERNKAIVEYKKEALDSLKQKNNSELTQKLEELLKLYPSTVEECKEKDRRRFAKEDEEMKTKTNEPINRYEIYEIGDMFKSQYASAFGIDPSKMRFDWAMGLLEYIEHCEVEIEKQKADEDLKATTKHTEAVEKLKKKLVNIRNKGGK